MKQDDVLNNLAYLLLSTGALLVVAFATTLFTAHGLYFMILAGCIIVFSSFNYFVSTLSFNLCRSINGAFSAKKLIGNKNIVQLIKPAPLVDPLKLKKFNDEKKKSNDEIKILRTKNHDLTTQVSGINHLWGKTSQKNFILSQKVTNLQMDLKSLGNTNIQLKKRIEKLQGQQTRMVNSYTYEPDFNELDIL